MSFSSIDTVWLEKDGEAVGIIDQSLLPAEVKTLRLRTAGEIFEAIRALRVRGAPAIGVAAVFGLYVLARGIKAAGHNAFMQELNGLKDYLNSSRPTAVNLSWALERMVNAVKLEMDREERLNALLRECTAIRDEDVDACRLIGENTLGLLRPGMTLLTHCNAGRLATVRYGTATSAMYLGHERGYGFKIFCDETRPLLQGARLTAYELMQAGMDVTLICDNMAASLMKEGRIDAVLVGADRIARNGDCANKIGTLSLAIAANRFGVPFYVCAPSSTIDLKTATGADIVIEQRPPEEVTELWYARKITPQGIKAVNPAFDVTDRELISAIITEKGIV